MTKRHQQEVTDKLNRLVAYLTRHIPNRREWLATFVAQLDHLSLTSAECCEIDSLHNRATFTAADMSAKTREKWRDDHHLATYLGKIDNVIGGAIRRDYCKRRGLKDRHIVNRLWKQLAGAKVSEAPPRLDHTEYFLRDNCVVVVNQPYLAGNTRDELASEIKVWATANGLSCHIAFDEGWHLPGHAMLYEFWRDDVKAGA